MELELELKEMNCNYFQSKSDVYEYFELNDVMDAIPTGYKAKLKFSIIGDKDAFVRLSRDSRASYEIGIIDI